MNELVNVDNFGRAETARMFDGALTQSGGTNQWAHLRGPVPLDRQTVIRMNRDTLYSSAIVNIREGARLTIPDCGDRYVSVMVVNQDHYINRILRDPGIHELTMDTYDTPYVMLAVRLFVDPSDAADIAAVNALQDQFDIDAASDEAYAHPEYDEDSLGATRSALLQLSEGLPDARHQFGAREDVDPVRHLIGTASGWGGLPEYEAFYTADTTPRAAAHHRITLRDVPVDAFWSVTVYNRDGYFEANEYDSFSCNSVTTKADGVGAVTIDLDTQDRGYVNHLYVMEGWNYVLRLYRPRAAVLDGAWQPPSPERVED